LASGLIAQKRKQKSCVSLCGTRILPANQFPKEEQMGKINYGRVILGGIVGGIVAFILVWFLNGVLLLQRWVDNANRLNPSGHNAASPLALLVSLFLICTVGNILITWIYAAVRPRLGAGMRTAVCVGLVTWALAFLLPNAAWSLTGIFSRRLLLYDALAGIAVIVGGAIVGAVLYKEAESTAAYPASAPQATH
jgi:hypothetical protein